MAILPEPVVAGVKVMVALLVLVESATLVAITLTVCMLGMLAGAVYKPLLLSVPGPLDGINVQVTAVFEVPDTIAVNCCVCDAVRLAFAGLMSLCRHHWSNTGDSSCESKRPGRRWLSPRQS